MKKIIALVMAVCLLLGVSAQTVFAEDEQWGWENPYDSGYWGPNGSGDAYDSGVVVTTDDPRDIELHGSIEPTIISVVVPSYIPFSISRSITNANKVVSPRIDVTNHSSVPVSVYVDNTKVDLSKLAGTTWATSEYVGYNQIAIGMMNSSSQPTHLYGAYWLQKGKQHTNVLNYVSSGMTQPLYVVGTLGSGVPENQSFTVTATLVVKRA